MDIKAPGQARILVIDDEPANVQLLEMVLEVGGYTAVTSTTDSRKALSMFVELEPDLVMLDLSMPHIDGFQVMDQLRAFISPESYLPIIVLTAMVGTEIKRRALASGATDFLTKPFDNIEVLLRVKNLLQTRQLYREINRYSETLEETVKERTVELRDALMELRETQQQVIQQERMHALAVMAGGVAHDFNNALSIILGFGELMLRDCEQNPSRMHEAKPLRAIVTAAQDAAHMVNRLSEFTRPETNEVRQAVDLKSLVTQAIALTEPRWKTQPLVRGVHIEVRSDCARVPSISGDPAELREALTNLIFNAVDAMPAGGVITIRLRSERDEVILEVNDTGIGMSEEVRRRCLEPFFTTKGDKGTGLGLAVVYGIFQRHGGTMEIRTEPQRGTSFIFRIPALSSIPVEESEPVSRNERRLRVLVVDDQELMCDILTQFLEQDWHEVEVARDGAEALYKLQGEKFDIVITDQSARGVAGDRLIPAIKQRLPEQHIILLSGFGADDHVALDAGADIVLGKPVSREALRRGIARIGQSEAR